MPFGFIPDSAFGFAGIPIGVDSTSLLRATLCASAACAEPICTNLRLLRFFRLTSCRCGTAHPHASLRIRDHRAPAAHHTKGLLSSN